MIYIFTCNEKYKKLAIYELEKFDRSFQFREWLDKEVGLFESELESQQLKNLIVCTPIIFVRHLFKVDGFIKKKII